VPHANYAPATHPCAVVVEGSCAPNDCGSVRFVMPPGAHHFRLRTVCKHDKLAGSLV